MLNVLLRTRGEIEDRSSIEINESPFDGWVEQVSDEVGRELSFEDWKERKWEWIKKDWHKSLVSVLEYMIDVDI